ETLLPRAAADVEPVAVGQPPVEDQQVVGVEIHQLLGLLDLFRLVAGEPRAGERADDERPQARIVLQNERSHGAILAARGLRIWACSCCCWRFPASFRWSRSRLTSTATSTCTRAARRRPAATISTRTSRISRRTV